MRVKPVHRFISYLEVLFLGIMPVAAQAEVEEIGTDMDFEELMNVTISVASKSEESISDAPGVISVLTSDELRRFGGTTLGDILKRVPSFLGTTVYFTDRSVIASRGDQVMPSSSHILLLINGRPMRESHEGGIKSEVYESFPVEVIERIEVIRGPGSVLYGSQAFSAVINVVTKSADENTVSVSGMLGENLYNNVSANVNYKIGDLGVVVAGRYANKGPWKTDWEAPNLAGGIDTVAVQIPNYGPGVYAELSYEKFRIMSSYTQWDNENFVPDYQKFKGFDFFPEGDATGRVTWKKLFTDAGYEHSFSDKLDASLNATYTRSWLESHAFPWTARDAYELLVEETNFYRPVENMNILLGGTVGYMTGWEGSAKDDSQSFNEGHTQVTLSGYLQVDYRWEWIKAIGGIQANKVEEFKADYNPRAGLLLYPLENMNIKALYSTAYRAPSMDELYLDHVTMRGQMVKRISADPIKEIHLEPEKVHTFDVGANFHNEKTQFGINAFHSRMEGLIFQDRDSTHYAIPTWDNLSDITIFGFECEGKYYVTSEILFEGSFLYQQSEDIRTDETNVSPLPKFSVKGGLSYRSDMGLTISAFNTFQQAVDAKYASDLNRTTKWFNMTNVYCEYDLNRTLNTSARKLALVLSIDNLLDEEVWLPAWGMINGSTIPYNEGRIIYGGFKVAF